MNATDKARPAVTKFTEPLDHLLAKHCTYYNLRSRNLDNIVRPLLASRSRCILNGLLFMSVWRRRGGAQNAFSHLWVLCEGTTVRTTGFAMINSAICDFSFCSITANTAFNPSCSTAYGIAVIFVISSLSAHRYPSTCYAYLYSVVQKNFPPV